MISPPPTHQPTNQPNNQITEQELEREVTDLRSRLADSQRTAREAAQRDVTNRSLALTQELTSQRGALDTLENQLSDARIANERLTRDNASLLSELEALKAELGSSLPAGTSAASGAAVRRGEAVLEALDRVQCAERERDDAAMRADGLERQLARLMQESSFERSRLQGSVAELQRRASELEAAALAAQTEAAGGRQRLLAVERELSSVKAAKAKTEGELRGALAALRTEKDLELKAMVAKMETTVAACNRSVADAEHLLDAKEALLARYKEEAASLAAKLERAVAAARADAESAAAELAAAVAKQEQLAAANMQLVAELTQLRTAAEETDRAMVQLHNQLFAARSREDDMQREVRSLQASLDRARLDHARLERARDAISAKYDAAAGRAAGGGSRKGVAAGGGGALPQRPAAAGGDVAPTADVSSGG